MYTFYSSRYCTVFHKVDSAKTNITSFITGPQPDKLMSVQGATDGVVKAESTVLYAPYVL